VAWLALWTAAGAFASQPAQPAPRPAAPEQAPLDLGLPDPLPIPPVGRSDVVAVDAAAHGSPRPAEVLDLRAAARATLERNADVEGAAARAEAAAYQRDAAAAAWRPRAELRLSQGRGRLESAVPPLTLDRDDRALVVRQSIVDEPARHEVVRQQRLADAAQAWAALVRGQALRETGEALLTLLAAEAGVRVAADHEGLLVALRDAVAEGDWAHAAADRDRVGARLANVRAQIADGRAAVQAAARNLERLTGQLPASIAVASLLGDPYGLQEHLPADDRAALAAVRARNDELVARRLEVAAADAEWAARRGRHLPRIELEVARQRATNPGGFTGRLDDTRATAVLVWPLASGGADIAQQRAAAARRVDAQARLRAAEGRLTQAVETAYANLAAVADRRAAVGTELENNRRLVAGLRREAVGPQTSVVDALDAFQREAQSRLDALQVEASLARTRWQLAQLTGTIETLFTGTGASTVPASD
jgi:adhesin transport system outer membrane protein